MYVTKTFSSSEGEICVNVAGFEW